MTLYDHPRTSIEHPSRSVPDDVADSLKKFREQDDAELARQQKLAQLARPTKAERRELSEIYESTAKARGLDVEQMRALHDISTRKSHRVHEEVEAYSASIRKELETYIRGESPFVPLPPWWGLDPVSPHAPDFWWATSTWTTSTSSISTVFDETGMHFFGMVSEHEGDDVRLESFEVTAAFELQANRIPESTSGRWLSTPHVELFGGLVGNTLGGLFIGDTWSKCWMHRKQTIFQNTFGPAGSEPLVRGVANESQTLINEVNESQHVSVNMPGFQFMPPVLVTNVNTANSLWAHLFIRFDIQAEQGSVELNPHVTIRTFQWPLQPLL